MGRRQPTGDCDRRRVQPWLVDGVGRSRYLVFDQEGDVFVRAARPGMEPTVRYVFEKAVLPIVMVARGYEAFHASAVRVPSGVIGFLGLSGTGKSTTAEALTRLGLDHYADDTLVYRLVGDRPLAVRLNFPARYPMPVGPMAPLQRLTIGVSRFTGSTICVGIQPGSRVAGLRAGATRQAI